MIPAGCLLTRLSLHFKSNRLSAGNRSITGFKLSAEQSVRVEPIDRLAVEVYDYLFDHLLHARTLRSGDGTDVIHHIFGICQVVICLPQC